jgi:Tol biopolymer transport system component
VLISIALLLAAMGAVAVGSALLLPTPELGIFEPLAGRIVYGDQDGIWGIDPTAPSDPPTSLSLPTSEAGIPLGWSSDGTRLLIMRESGPGAFILLVLHTDGSETQLTEAPLAIRGDIRGATISPDGSRVAFAGACDGGSGLCIVDAEGGPAERLVDARGLLQQPTFSPDGTQIAYTDGAGDHSNEVWLVDADGSDPHAIVLNEVTAGHVYGLAWSPAGDRIALGLEDTIYTFAIDGSDFTQVAGGDTTCGPAEPCAVTIQRAAGLPYWSPDGSEIAYTTGCLSGVGSVDRAGCGLAIADADGSNVRTFGIGASGPWHPGARPSSEVPSPSPQPSEQVALPSGEHPGTPEPRQDGEFIVFQSLGPGRGWDLAAQDPETGGVRTIVETDGIVDCADASRCTNFVRKAEWSADGRWIAFEVSNASPDGPPVGPCAPQVGIWAQGPDGAPRQLTTPCDVPPSGPNDPVEELWEWSPVDARLAYERIDGETDELSVIDVADGTRTSLVTGSIDPPYPVDSDSIAWSPDGSRIAYVDRSSIYAVDVDSGERSLLADSFEDTIDIAWSPDGTQMFVHDQGRYRIQVMNADGSDLHVVLEGADASCETSWSPSGDRIVYMLSISGASEVYMPTSEVWTVAPDGSNPISIYRGCGDSLPVWAPNGTHVAYLLGCDRWVVERADGTGDVQPIDELEWRSWYSSGLTASDLAEIGQVDH